MLANFERLIDQIYEAAADPNLWPHVMHEFAGSVDAAGGIILTRRADACATFSDLRLAKRAWCSSEYFQRPTCPAKAS